MSIKWSQKKFRFFFLSLYYIYLCMGVGVQTSWHTCRGQRTTCLWAISPAIRLFLNMKVPLTHWNLHSCISSSPWVLMGPSDWPLANRTQAREGITVSDKGLNSTLFSCSPDTLAILIYLLQWSRMPYCSSERPRWQGTSSAMDHVIDNLHWLL